MDPGQVDKLVNDWALFLIENMKPGSWMKIRDLHKKLKDEGTNLPTDTMDLVIQNLIARGCRKRRNDVRIPTDANRTSIIHADVGLAPAAAPLSTEDTPGMNNISE